MKNSQIKLIIFFFFLFSFSINAYNNYRILLECYPNCEECSESSTDDHNMHCISCKEGFNFYKKSNNCLKCPKYINYNQTECIDTIPDGYYLENKELGTLGICHHLCKKCDGPPTYYGMHCTECIYEDKDFYPPYDTDCPDGIDEEEEYPPMPGGQCPRDEPILVRNDFCSMVYCTEQEFKDGICEIRNSIIETQWINNVERFSQSEIKNICLDYGDNGELFLFAQEIDQNDDRWLYIYGIDKNQRPMFIENNMGKNYYSYFKKVYIPYNVTLENIKIMKNFENDKLFLISTQIKNEMYVIDYINNKTIVHKFNQNSFSSQLSEIIYIKALKDVYITNFILCQSDNNCFGYLRKFKFVTNNNDINIIKEITLETKLNPERNFICIESFSDYIQCLYTAMEQNEYILDLFDVNNLEPKYKFRIENELDDSLRFLDSMIKLNDNTFIIAYSLKNNIIKVLIKNMGYNETSKNLEIYDYIPNVPYIKINENNSYIFEDITTNRNSLCTINENKFAILLNIFNGLKEGNYQNNQIIIYIFNIFNEHKNINMRKYSINFKLYNMLNYGKILGYTFGNFFGILIELSSPENKNIVNSGFITFGYSNTINNTYEINDNDFFPKESEISNPIRFREYFKNKLENNLFGYSLDGVIILYLIDKNIGYFFTGYNYKIIENQIIPLNSEIRLEIYRNYTPGNYSIEFASVASEPRYEDVDKYAEEIYSYPNGTEISEKDFYKPNILIGRRIVYNFEIKKDQYPKQCYPSCETCEDYSEDSNNQKCLTCRRLFYFINGTQNCFNYAKEHYYFDEETEKYYPCYKDCLTCDKKETSIQNMNCLSCSKDFIFYNKSRNCMKCPNYINYPQTQCISSVPEGYYVLNETLGLIEPCYHLCKKCSKGPKNDTRFYMNCEICLYENKNFMPSFPGDCPQSQGIDTDEDPVDGQCPKDKPILKDNKCKMIYCTKKEFEDKTCIIYNDIIKKQWFNKFNIFQDESSNIKYDINNNGEIFLLAQKKNGNNIDMFLYGFNKNYGGLFYDKNNKSYVPNKKISLKNSNLFSEKIKYIEIDKKGYLLDIVKDSRIHLIDLDSNEHYINFLPNIPTKIDKFEKYLNTNNDYFYSYTYCNNNGQSSFDTCYIGLTNYKINSKDNFNIDLNNEEEIRIKPDTKLICINNIFSSNYILCKYNSFELLDENTYISNHILTLFDINTLSTKRNFILDKYFMPDKQVIDAMFPMDGNKSNFIIVYSTSKNIIKILFKTLKNDYKDLEDVINEVPYININTDLKYNLNGDVFSNDVCKIDNNNFALLMKTHKINEDINTGLLVVTLRIFNLAKVIVRYYHVNLNLYNFNLNGNIIGYNLNGILGALLEINTNDKVMGKSLFLTFGFVNSTIDVRLEKGTQDLIINKKILKLRDYITEIENNIFGYEIEQVQILNIPDPYKVGGFLNLKDNYNIIQINDNISISSELEFKIVKEPIAGNYSISFAGIIKEPSEQIAINIDDKSEYYPPDSTHYDYNLKNFIGKIFTYNFAVTDNKIKCYPNCEECLYTSEDINSQSCLKCKSGFYFVHDTKNCFDKLEHKYYFNYTAQEFYPCYKDCYTCNTKEINSTYMNCLACSTPFKFYEKNKNCLNCDKYVNFKQTQCINEIPDGFYLKDKEKGIIDKCYKLCKTCSKKEVQIGSKFYMNCDTCLYKNNSKVTIEGNCPENENEDVEESKSNFVVYFSIILSVIIIIVAGIVVYFKFCRKNKYKLDPSNYLNIDGKNISFDDEEDSGIN